MPHRFSLVILCLFTVIGSGCDRGIDDAYVADINAWHAQRLEGLRSETGWLTLVGLHPLGPGANEVGSSADNDVVLNTPAQTHVGTITLVGEKATFFAAAGVAVSLFVDGAPAAREFPGGEIRTDGQGAPDLLTVDSLIFYVIQRGEKYFLRVKDRQAKALLDFQGIERYPVDQAWRVTAKLEGEPGKIRVVNVLGQAAAEPSPGTLVFDLRGQTYRLRPTGEPGAGLFVVFGDGTSGHGTYAGGRFLVTDPPAADGTVVLDFNRAYNPPCVFSEFATCPLPSQENMLLIEITAGEKNWGTGH